MAMPMHIPPVLKRFLDNAFGLWRTQIPVHSGELININYTMLHGLRFGCTVHVCFLAACYLFYDCGKVVYF